MSVCIIQSVRTIIWLASAQRTFVVAKGNETSLVTSQTCDSGGPGQAAAVEDDHCGVRAVGQEQACEMCCRYRE